jgi:predicted GNAT family acetyltransferase
MAILHREDKNEGVFYLEENGDALAEMVYKKEKGKMIIQHTEVDESLRGKNIGFNWLSGELIMRGKLI